MDKGSCVFYISVMLSDITRHKFSQMSDDALAQICDLVMQQESFKIFLTFDNIRVYPQFKTSKDYVEYQINRYCNKKDLEFNPSLVKLFTPVILKHRYHKHIIKSF